MKSILLFVIVAATLVSGCALGPSYGPYGQDLVIHNRIDFGSAYVFEPGVYTLKKTDDDSDIFHPQGIVDWYRQGVIDLEATWYSPTRARLCINTFYDTICSLVDGLGRQ